MKRFKKLTQRTLSFLLAISILATTALSGVVAADQENDMPEVLSVGETDTEFTPVMRFVVTSDVHIRVASANYMSYERLEQLYTTAYAYSEAQTDYNKIDGFFFVGDNTQTGHKQQQEYFFNYLEENTKEGSVSWAVMGNHEFKATGQNYADLEGATAKFLEYSGYDTKNNHIILGGYHVILLSNDLYDTTNHVYFNEESLAWLEQELEIAAADTPDKPIFVMQHEPAYGTMKGSNGGDKGVKAVLDKYPQVIDFSGHTHNTVSDPRSIWQGSFTALNTGSLCYASVPIIGTSYNEGGGKAIDYEGGWATGSIDDSVRNAGMYYIVEVDADSRVRILIYNIFTESLWGEPYILDSIDPADFTYTADRANDAVKPEFAASDALTLDSSYYKNVTLTIPHATCKDVVQSYRAEVYQGGELVQTIYRTSGANYGEAAPAVKLYIKDLEPSTAYTVKVYACSSWGLESDPLTARVITSAVNTTVKADVLDVVFQEDGTAVNKVNGETLSVNGAPTVTYNEEQGRYVASFDGSDDAYSFDGIHNWYDVMSNALTLEAYAYLEETPTESYVNVVSNQQSGGFGFTYKSDGKMYFYCMAGSDAYTCPGAQVQTGKWIHLVGTYDGEAVRLYVDGELVSEEAASGELVYPAHSARFMALGADSAVLKYASFFNGDIATAKVYTEALTAEQVAERYRNVNANESTDDGEVLIGDADSNGVVDTADAELILNYLVGWNTALDTAAADVNGNGAVDTHDATLILLADEEWEEALESSDTARLELTDYATNVAALNVSAGDTLELLVSLPDNPGMSSLHTTLRLPEGWKVTECTDLTLFDGTNGLIAKASPSETEPYSCLWLLPTADDALYANGGLAVLRVTIPDTVATGTYEIKLDASSGTLEEDNWLLNADGGKSNVAVSAATMSIQVTGIPVVSGACPEHTSSNAWMPVGQNYMTANSALTSGHYILTEDIRISEAFTVAAGEEVCIDLNGYDITAPNTNGIRVFFNAGTLTIVDSAEADGVISGGKVVGVDNNNTYDGATNALGGNIYNAGTFNLYGGTVSGGSASSTTIYAKSLGGNIYGEADSVINIYGGAVISGTVTRTAYTTDVTIGGGGNIYSLGAVTISGGTVAEGRATCTYSNTNVKRFIYLYGGNLFMDAGSELKVSGGVITDGTVEGARTNTTGLAPITVGGGNIYANGAAVSISGGTVTNGSAKATVSGCGTESAAFANAKVYGGNIYVSGGTLAVSNGTVSGGKATMDASNTGVTTKDADAILYINGGNIFVSTVAATISGGVISGGCAYLTGDYGAAKGGNIYIASGTTVTMTDGTVTGGESDNNGGNLFVSGTLNMSGGKITLGRAENKSNTGGNLYISGTGSVSLSGTAAVRDGHAYYRGGNIYISNKGELTLSGSAAVTGGNVNSTASASNWGGNIYITGASASVKLYDDAVVSGGLAYPDRGGNIATNSGAKIYMYGGSITDGQVRLGSAGTEAFYLYGGTVSEFITAGSKLIYLYNGTITGCDMQYLSDCACAVDNGDGSYTVWHTGADDGTCVTCAFDYAGVGITMELGKHTFADAVCTICGTEDPCTESHDYDEDPLVCGKCGYVRAELKISKVTLKPGVAGLYFGGDLEWKDTDEQIISWGITVSLENPLPVADDSDQSCLYTQGGISALVTNILSEDNTDTENARNARMPVYARAYVQLVDGRYIYSEPVQVSLHQVVLAAESKWDSLSATQKSALCAMYRSFSAVMGSWQIPNIKEQ